MKCICFIFMLWLTSTNCKFFEINRFTVELIRDKEVGGYANVARVEFTLSDISKISYNAEEYPGPVSNLTVLGFFKGSGYLENDFYDLWNGTGKNLTTIDITETVPKLPYVQSSAKTKVTFVVSIDNLFGSYYIKEPDGQTTRTTRILGSGEIKLVYEAMIIYNKSNCSEDLGLLGLIQMHILREREDILQEQEFKLLTSLDEEYSERVITRALHTHVSRIVGNRILDVLGSTVNYYKYCNDFR